MCRFGKLELLNTNIDTDISKRVQLSGCKRQGLGQGLGKPSGFWGLLFPSPGLNPGSAYGQNVQPQS